MKRYLLVHYTVSRCEEGGGIGAGKGRETYLEAEGVELVGVGCVQGGTLLDVAPPAVGVGIWAKVQRAVDNVVAPRRVREVVAARGCDVDFARPRPLAVDLVDGQHPDGGPQPVARRQLGDDFDPPVLDVGAALGVDARRLDGLDDGAVGRVGRVHAVAPVGASAALVAQIEDDVVFHEVFVLERGSDEEGSILYPDVFVSVGSLLELAVSRAESLY